MKLKGILDIVLIMTLTILAVIYLGPIIIGIPDGNEEESEEEFKDYEFTCSETGRPIKEYLLDDYGEKIGIIRIQYHDNGSFKQVIEENFRDRTKMKVYYSEDNDFLYWYEFIYDENWNEISSAKYDAVGLLIR